MQNGYLVFGILGVLMMSSLFIPAFAEVINFEIDKEQVTKRQSINFSGTVENEDSGLVTIVIRGPENEFVMLKQARISADNTFETDIDVNPKFILDGNYTATSFVLNMTAGQIGSFEYFSRGIPVIEDINDKPEEIVIVDEIPTNENIVDEEIIKENTVDIKPVVNETTLASFVDPKKDPQHYVDRYHNEIIYKEWFDEHFPQYDSIYDAVGLEVPTPLIETKTQSVIPTAEASLSTPSTQKTDRETTHVIMAIASLGILFGAVYGIKRKVDDNSEQIEANKMKIKEKLLGAIPRSDPKQLLKTRLAKGEITIAEYEKLSKVLN